MSIRLFNDKKDCCGCGGCMNICPTASITMEEDECGFIYPTINEKTCINCGLCEKTCAYQRKEAGHIPMSAYVAAAKDSDIILNSASGGVFAAIAHKVIDEGGAVFGCSLEMTEQGLCPRHIMVESHGDIHKLQGSKYVQSFMGDSFKQVKAVLNSGRQVLFSGTPCQAGALRAFLGKYYSNLLIIDIICHGVPNAAFFKGYIEQLEKSLGGRVTEFKFRDKSLGWGYRGRVEWEKQGKKHIRQLPISLSSYYQMFLTSDICRENCYSCKYASSERPGDMTIGDFWGIGALHPEYTAANGGFADEKKGVSCIMVNTALGETALKKYCQDIMMEPSEFSKAAKHNAQLRQPSKKGADRELILEMYRRGGYEEIEEWYNKRLGIKKLGPMLVSRLPYGLQARLRSLLGK